MQLEPIARDWRLGSWKNVSSVSRLKEETPKESEIRLGKSEQVK